MKQANESRSPFTLQSINGGGSAAKPQCRIEEYLNAIEAAWLGVTPLPAYPTEPVWRIELFLAAILSAVKGDDPPEPCPEPTRRREEFLRAIYDEITGASPAWPCPAQANTRIEEYLKAAYDRVANGTETPVPAPAWTIEAFIAAAVEAIPVEQTYGPAALVTFNAATAKAIKSLVVNMLPAQNLNGYASPWPAGGGVSKCPSFANGTHTMTNGLTVTIQDGEITIDGTASSAGYYEEDIESTVMPADAYVSFNNPVGTFNIAYVFIHGSTQIAAPSLSPANGTKQPTGLSGATVNKLRIFCNAATYDNFKMSPIVHDGSTPQAWQPYANICPISGRSGLNVYVSPTEDIADATAYAEDWTLQAGTVYGGTVDVVSGALKARPYIASYTGETLVGPWVSSMDAYTPGGTPTAGAQVVDVGGTETSYQLTPQEINTLVGANDVWSDSGDVTVVV